MNNDLIEFKNDPALSQKKQNIEEFKKTIIKTTIGRMYYHFPALYTEVKKLSISYINLINPSNETKKDLLEEENNTNDGDRVLKKSNNHFELGEILTKLVKEGPPQSAFSWLILSNVAKNNEFNLKPDSKLIKDVYRSLLD